MPAVKGQTYNETGLRAQKAKEAHRAKACKNAGVESFDQLIELVRLLSSQERTIKEICQQLSIGVDLVKTIRKENDIAAPDRISLTKRTNLEKYGVENVMSVPEVKQKHQSKVEEIWSDHKDVIIEKQNATNLERYGVKRPLQNVQIYEKRTATMIERHQYSSYALIPGKSKQIYEEVALRYNGSHPIQDRSNGWTSRYETEMGEFLTVHGLSFKTDRKVLSGKEIDLYLEAEKLGFEMCGIWAHSESNGKGRNYHYDKFKGCKKQSVRLITIWDYEWDNRQNQILNFVKSVIGVNRKVPARQCEKREIDLDVAAKFVFDHHIQPLAKMHMTRAFGLFLDEELISVMSFGNHHRGGDDLVLNRFCSKDGVTVVGGASKLFKFAQSVMNFDRCVSWSDNRWSWGNVYDTLGFKRDREYRPDYFYVAKNGKPMSKQQCTKSKLKAAENQTELERAHELGMSRVWDCGKVRWVWSKG